MWNSINKVKVRLILFVIVKYFCFVFGGIKIDVVIFKFFIINGVLMLIKVYCVLMLYMIFKWIICNF